MIDIAAASAAISTISSAVKLVDTVYDTWKKFRETGKVEASGKVDHYEKITKSETGDALVHSTDGHVAKEVTREELAKILGKNELSVLNALEKKMEILVAKWSGITEKFELLTPSQQGASKVELSDICDELAVCLDQIMTMLESIGFQLQDHYGAIKMIAAQR